MNKFIYILSSFFGSGITSPGYGQTGEPARYKDLIYSGIIVQKNLCYSRATTPGMCKASYLLDLYQPESDKEARRPLIIWMHGGGFKFGSKRAKGIQLWCKSFARRGYVCAAINYRLSKKNPLFNFGELTRSCREAVQDVRQAIAFFRENHELFRIDTNRILLAGNSAGGMVALQAAYGNDAGAMQSQNAGTHIAAVINFWGAIFNINWLENARIPIVSVHGMNDRTVPFDHKGSSLYGSFAIHAKADSLHIPNRLKIYEGYSHELQRHFNPLYSSKATKERWLEAGQFAADFLYDELFSGVPSAR